MLDLSPFYWEKLENAILYFAREFKKHTHRYMTQTYLYKFLSFLDEAHIKTMGETAFNLEYKALEKGPVPIKLYENIKSIQSNKFKVFNIPGKTGLFIKSAERVSFNPDYFADFELDEMKKLIFIFADSSVKSFHISEATHENIKAWGVAWYQKKKPGQKAVDMDWSDTFDGIHNKPFEELKHQEEHLLTIEAFKKMESGV